MKYNVNFFCDYLHLIAPIILHHTYPDKCYHPHKYLYAYGTLNGSAFDFFMWKKTKIILRYIQHL